MDAATQRDILRRAVRVLETGLPEMADSVIPSPVRRYVDAAQFAAEQKLFRRYPQPVAAASEVTDSGDWLARTCVGSPVLITRDTEGKLNAFLNVCRHRGMQVAPCGSGKARQHFSCPYHAWKYGADGSLQFVLKEFGFPGIDKSALGLRRLAVAERAGLIWVVTDPALKDTDVSAMLGPLADELENLGFATHVGYAPRRFQLKSNWKLIADGSLEDYHFKILHQNTSAPFFVDTAQIVDEFGLNRRLFLIKRSLQRLAPEEIDGCNIREYGNILYYFFPGTWVLVQPDHAMVTFLSPAGVSITDMDEVALISKLPDAADAKTKAYWDENVDLFRRTLDEDYVLVEVVQSGLASGANEVLQFGRYEFVPARFHQQLEAALEMT